MNITDISIDSIVTIFSYIDGNSLLQAMKTCKFFKCIVNKIIEEANHNDIYPYLFLIPSLSDDTLQKYLLKIYTFYDMKWANLMLAAFTSGNYAFVSLIVTSIFNMIPHRHCIFNSISKNNQVFAEHDFFRCNTFFNSIPIHIKEISWNFIDYQSYFDTWTRMIMNVGRIDIFDQMFQTDESIKYRIFDSMTKFSHPKTAVIAIRNKLFIQKNM